MFKRQAINKISTRLREPRSFIQVLMGPRQVGKTTLVHQLLTDLPDSIYESADGMAANAVWLEQIWEGARVRLHSAEKKEIILVVDEIQKINNWSEIVKKMYLFKKTGTNRRNNHFTHSGSPFLLLNQFYNKNNLSGLY